MAVDLDVIIFYKSPISEADLLKLPERLSAPSFRLEAEHLLKVVGYPGVQTNADREEFCSWHWQNLANLRWFSKRRSWPGELRRKNKQGQPPSMSWAGFHVDFHPCYIRMTHIENYGAFLRNSPWGHSTKRGLQESLRRCCRLVANTFGASKVLYLPDSGDSRVQIARTWAGEEAHFDSLISRLEKEFGKAPTSLFAGNVDDYFIDEFEGLDDELHSLN